MMEVQVEKVGTTKIEFVNLPQFSAIEFSRMNMRYTSSGGVKPLPCARVTVEGTESTLSQWHLRGFWARLRFLFTGKLWLCTLGIMHPPVALFTGNPFEGEK